MFRWVATVIGAFWKVYIPYRSLLEALYTLNSPPVVSFNLKPKPSETWASKAVAVRQQRDQGVRRREVRGPGFRV